MSGPSPYEVKRKEYRLDKSDNAAVEVTFTIKGPTVCTKKFPHEDAAKRECAAMNEIYNKGYSEGIKAATPPIN